MMKRCATAGLLAALLAVTVPSRAQETGPWGTLRRKDGVGEPYRLTAEDALWSARMLVGEAGGKDDVDSTAVMWCMLNSYMLRPVRDRYPTFQQFIRAYCTPLQTFLSSKGALERHRRRGTKMVEVEPGKFQLERHVELQQRPWEKLPATARALVERVLRGKQPSVCANATQFCSTAVYFADEHGRRPTPQEHAEFTRAFAAKKTWVWVQVEGADPKNNVFFAEERFAQLPAGVVEVLAPGR